MAPKTNKKLKGAKKGAKELKEELEAHCMVYAFFFGTINANETPLDAVDATMRIRYLGKYLRKVVVGEPRFCT